MVITKRLDSKTTSIYEQPNGGVGLLEKNVPVSYNEQVATNTSTNEKLNEQRERMQRNLDKLLNYDKYEAQETKTPVQEKEIVKEKNSLPEDDIRPTLTTMQFGDEENVNQMRSEMRSEEREKNSYAISGRGKLAMVLYALAVVVVMALIVLNTGVLANLNKSNVASEQALNGKISEYQAIMQDINYISDNSYVLERANELGMIKK